MFKMMEKVAKEERPAFGLDSIVHENNSMYPANTIQMYFTSNHDENSWNHADFGTFPGMVHTPFAVFTQTMVNSVPLIYGGQEEPVLRALKIFDKDLMAFDKLQRATFYKTLLVLRNRNAALSADASFRKMIVGDEKAVYAFVREKGKDRVLVVLNLSANTQAVAIKDKTLFGNAYNGFKNTKELISSKGWNMLPWGFAVYEYK